MEDMITENDIIGNITNVVPEYRTLISNRSNCIFNDNDNLYEHKLEFSVKLGNIMNLCFKFTNLRDDNPIKSNSKMDLSFCIGGTLISDTKMANRDFTVYDDIQILPYSYYFFENLFFSEINIKISIYTINKIDDILKFIDPVIYYTLFDIKDDFKIECLKNITHIFIPDHELLFQKRLVLHYNKMRFGNYFNYSNGLCGLQYIT